MEQWLGVRRMLSKKSSKSVMSKKGVNCDYIRTSHTLRQTF